MSKAALKNIREAIDQEKFEEAIEKCEDLLKKDPRNPMAYTLLGAAYQSSNKTEARKCLLKAIECSPEQPVLALQGLANCSPLEELPTIYEQLLNLVPEKYVHYCEKLFQMSSSRISIVNDCVRVLRTQTQTQTGSNRSNALKFLAKIWIGNKLTVDIKDMSLLRDGLEEVVKDKNDAMHLNCYKHYLKAIYQEMSIDDYWHESCLFADMYPEDAYTFGLICKIYCENHNRANSVHMWKKLKYPITYYADKLLELNEESGSAILVRAIDLFNQQQFVAAREQLQRVQDIIPNYAPCLELLARTNMELYAHLMALQQWQKFYTPGVEYAVCMSYSNDKISLKTALPMLLKFESNDDLITDAVARCYFKLGMMDKLESLPLSFLTRLQYQREPDKALQQLESANMEETFEKLLLLGTLQLNVKDMTNALNNMLKATKLRPYRSDCYYYLGRIYREIGDKVRARKCLEKCLHLNPLCADGLNNLCLTYNEMNQEDLNIAILSNTLKRMGSENPKEIYFKLGMTYLRQTNWDDAIQSFRNAIKWDATCVAYWELLGDAYSERGSFNSALRVFSKILELDPNHTYAKLQIAVIQTTVRMYSKAIVDFNTLLLEEPDYLPALKGAAEAHMGMADNLRQQYRFGRCKKHLQIAADYLQRALNIHKTTNMVWLWRLIASVCVETAQMPKSMANLEFMGELLQSDEKTVLLDRIQLLQLATKFYARGLKVKQNTYLWYELALCNYYQAQYATEGQADLFELARKSCQMAINAQHDRWENWNLLGVIYTHEAGRNYALAQHCFIAALQYERKSYITWTNLGGLYLHLGDKMLANQAFQRAQQSSPVYPNAWIGQAMIAEMLGEEEEAMDLFRHCQQFELHPEAALGYARWVCSTLTNPLKCERPHFTHALESMYADIVALDAINWYTTMLEDDACLSAYSFLGYLCARQKLYNPAIKAYLQGSKRATEPKKRDLMTTNLGYVYLKANRPRDAIAAFDSVSQTNFKAAVGTALAYFRSGQHAESYNLYNSLLNAVEDSEQGMAAMILVAMASVMYASQGESDTKKILYPCILMENSPIQALYSACALGILHKDVELTEMILLELKKYNHSEEYSDHIAYLTAQHYAGLGQPRKGLAYLTAKVHMFPCSAKLRKVLADYLLEHLADMQEYTRATSQIALSAFILGHQNKKQKSSCTDDSASLLTASRAIRPVNERQALKLAQKAVHLYPQNESAWNSLRDISQQC